MTGEQISRAIAAEWDRIAAALGPELPDFESKLLPLLRALEQNPVDQDALANILKLIEAHGIREAVQDGLDRTAPHRTKGVGPTDLLQSRYRYTKVPVFF